MILYIQLISKFLGGETPGSHPPLYETLIGVCVEDIIHVLCSFVSRRKLGVVMEYSVRMRILKDGRLSVGKLVEH